MHYGVSLKMTANDIIRSSREGMPKTNYSEALYDPKLRELIYTELHPAPVLEDRPLLLKLFSLEVSYRNDRSNSGEYFENLYWCALFLYQLGSLDDILPMWRAKNIDMDTGYGFDIQFIVGAGVHETLTFLSEYEKDEAKEAYNYIVSCRESGDFEDLGGWLEYRIEYYS